ILGLAKKVVVADSLAALINPALANWHTLSTGDAWLCALGYTYQLYFDFSGYSDMAVGLGRMFNLSLPQNFNSPYKAEDIADFWRRWHISLSSVLRDYLYIPLGGGRHGTWNTYRNLLITMLLGGLWHGANWTFVAWGGYHGALLILNRWSEPWLRVWPQVARRAVTFLLVVIGWVLFRSDSFAMARGLLTAMFTPVAGMTMTAWPTLIFGIAVSAALAHLGPNSFELRFRWTPARVLAYGAAFAACLAMILVGQQSPFLYFQF
ncbi:MAG TPA: MBOAT family O-acyltransferase, partial [Bryobacteraceae bacterium]|nr:MBOAT family O-acyltransferase [Bryobacteraceae bacterium]